MPAAADTITFPRVPEGRDDWKPHDKSMPMGRLVVLVAGMPEWIDMMIRKDELDLNPPGGSAYKPPSVTARDERLEVWAQILEVPSETIDSCGGF